MYLIKMNPNPYYYGLVKQIGPWKTTQRDLEHGQYYNYTPNDQTVSPYDVPAGNGSVYAQYSSQGLIYDATTTPTIVSQGKVKQGRVVKSKKIMLIGAGGIPTSMTPSDAMQNYMEYAKQGVQVKIFESNFGPPSEADAILKQDIIGRDNTSPIREGADASMWAAKPESPTDAALAGLINTIDLSGEKMLGVEESIVSRDEKMASPVGVTDQPYGDIESTSSASPVKRFSELSFQEQKDVELKAHSLLAKGYSIPEVEKMLYLKLD